MGYVSSAEDLPYNSMQIATNIVDPALWASPITE